jgi:glycosyltransferase involved in cell wall biosynthesis
MLKGIIREALQLKKVSIIIPCYNAEQYITRCIESLVKQTIGINNLELILVNDASTDNTLEMLYQWEQKFPESIMIIDCEENGKQGKARNIGLSYATAEYVGFADNDDIVEPGMFEALYDKAIRYNSDIVICGSKKHTIEQLTTTTMGRANDNDRFLVINSEDDRAAFLDTDINIAIWNKLYKKSIISDNYLTFPEGFIYDDICFSELIKHYVSRIYILEGYHYHHILRSDAASYSTKNWQNKLGWFDVQKIKILELRERGLYSKYVEKYEREFFIDYITLVKNFLKTYGYMPPQILNEMKNQSVELFPNYKEIPIFKKMLQGEAGDFFRMVCEGFDYEINDAYIEEMVSALQ